MVVERQVPPPEMVRMTTGILSAIYEDSLLVGVDLGSGSTVQIPRIGSYGPKIGDVVVVLSRSERMVVLGSLTTDAPIDGQQGTPSPMAAAALASADFVLKSGDTMTGRLKLNGLDPTSDAEAVTRAYADRSVKKSGDTMDGRLTLEGGIRIAPPPGGTQTGDVLTSTGVDGDGEWAPVSAMVADLVSDPVLINWFGPDQLISPWAQVNGAGAVFWDEALDAPTVPGVMRISLEAGQSAMVEWQGGFPLPYGIDDLYRIRIRARGNAGFISGGRISAGFIGYAADRTTIVDIDNNAVLLNPHAAMLNMPIPPEDTDLFIDLPPEAACYLSGRSEGGAQRVPAAGGYADWDSAVVVASDVRYWRPFISASSTAAGADLDIDSIEIYRLDSSVKVPMGIVATAVQAEVGTFDNLRAGGSLVKEPTAEELAAGGVDGWVLTSDAVGEGTWQRGPSPLVPGVDPPPNPGIGDIWWDLSRPYVEPFYTEVKSSGTTTYTIPAGGSAQVSGWDTWSIDVPCNGIFVVEFSAYLRPATADGYAIYFPAIKDATDCTAASTDATTQGYARVTSAAAAAGYFNARGRHVILVTDVAPGGGTIEFCHMAAASGTGNMLYNPRASYLFLPYMNERYTVLTTTTP